MNQPGPSVSDLSGVSVCSGTKQVTSSCSLLWSCLQVLEVPVGSPLESTNIDSHNDNTLVGYSASRSSTTAVTVKRSDGNRFSKMCFRMLEEAECCPFGPTRKRPSFVQDLDLNRFSALPELRLQEFNDPCVESKA